MTTKGNGGAGWERTSKNGRDRMPARADGSRKSQPGQVRAPHQGGSVPHKSQPGRQSLQQPSALQTQADSVPLQEQGSPASARKTGGPLKGTMYLLRRTEVPVDMETLMELLSGRQSMLTDISKEEQ